MLPALNDTSSQQAQPTENTRAKTQKLMDYAATYPDAYIRYYASDMILHVDSDAAYLVLPKARSRIAGYYYFSKPNGQLNGPVHIECRTIEHVVASAVEAETSGTFHNGQTTLPFRIILIAIEHPQPPTPIKTDNTTAHGFIYDNIQLKRSKSWDMRYYWLRDKRTHGKFKLFWEKGTSNEADYFTKHHPTIYHRQMRPRYIKDKIEHAINSMASVLRGCIIPCVVWA